MGQQAQKLSDAVNAPLGVNHVDTVAQSWIYIQAAIGQLFGHELLLSQDRRGRLLPHQQKRWRLFRTLFRAGGVLNNLRFF